MTDICVVGHGYCANASLALWLDVPFECVTDRVTVSFKRMGCWHIFVHSPNTSSVRSFPVNNTWWPHILAYEVNIPELSGLVPLETLWAKPFKCHMSAVTRALFKSYSHWRTFSLLEYENVHVRGRCSSVHPLEIKGICLEISYLWM
jgi:hypothetical protein